MTEAHITKKTGKQVSAVRTHESYPQSCLGTVVALNCNMYLWVMWWMSWVGSGESGTEEARCEEPVEEELALEQELALEEELTLEQELAHQ